MAQEQSTAAALSVVLGAIAFFVSPLLGFILGGGAVVLGALGLLRAASPRTKGALAALIGLVLGAIAATVKVIEGALRLIF